MLNTAQNFDSGAEKAMCNQTLESKPHFTPRYFLFEEAINLNLHHYHFFLYQKMWFQRTFNILDCHVFLEQYYTRYMDICATVWLTIYMYLVPDKRMIFQEHRIYYTGFQQCCYATMLSLQDPAL